MGWQPGPGSGTGDGPGRDSGVPGGDSGVPGGPPARDPRLTVFAGDGQWDAPAPSGCGCAMW